MFVHLHVHTEHSQLDGLTRVSDLFDTAAAQGSPAVAITDHKSLAGMWEAKRHSERTGVKLVPGLEAYIAIGQRTERKTIEVEFEDSASEGGDAKRSSAAKTRTYEHLTILARNRAGWQNLVRLHNESSMHKHGRAQLIDYDVLKEYGDGLIILTGCVGGPVFGPLSRAVAAEAEIASATSAEAREAATQNRDTEARRADDNLQHLIDAVGKENVYVEVMEHGNAAEQAALPKLREAAEKHGLHLIATNDSHHTSESDRVAHNAWLALQTDSTLTNSKFSFHGTGYHLRTPQEMRELIPEEWWVTACNNTVALAERVDRDALPNPHVRLPEFPLPDGFETNTLYLRSLLEAGISDRWEGELTEEHRRRLNTELATINSMGFIDYFLIVHEMITWARSQDFYVGPGRGSAAGSLVAYILGITQIDPVEYGLLFERFLEPGRAELPDIDIDFESRHKQHIIKHLTELWGTDRVAQIGSIGRPQIRQAFKDAMRVLEEPASLADKLAKLLPEDLTAAELHESRETGAIERDGDRVVVSEFWSATPSVKHIDTVLSLANTFYDVAKTSGIHASGVVIAPAPLTDLVPMRWSKPGSADWHRWVTEWDHHDLENFGLVKFDVLAIRNLDMAHLSIDSIAERTGEQLGFYELPHPDLDSADPRVQRTFQMLQQGRTAGVFQLESPAMTRLLEEVSPDTLEELSAVVALFRPGPLSAGMHTRYADRKHGREVVSYDYLTHDPEEARWLDTVLGKTQGLMVFQESLMQLGRVIAGFDDVWRSKLRKAVSKKNEQLMAEVGAKLIEDGGKEFRDENGVVYSPQFSPSTVNHVFEAMKGAASYAFNASHSIAYAYIAYITAYLKANYPAHYGAATLSVTPPDKAEKRLAAIHALLDEGMKVLPPRINESAVLSAPNPAADAVLIGLSEIKGVGSVAERIVEERDAGGPFESLPDLLRRVTEDDRGAVKHTSAEALIDSGALDEFGTRMGVRFVARLGVHNIAPIPNMEYTPLELSVRQTGRLLMTLDPGVREQVQDSLTKWQRPDSEGFTGPEASTVSVLTSSHIEDGSVEHVSGLLTQYEEKPYRQGTFARITLEDAKSSISGVLWDRERTAAKQVDGFPRIGFPVVLFGKIGTRSFTVKGGGDEEDGKEDREITRQEIAVRSVHPMATDLRQRGGVDPSPYPPFQFTEQANTETRSDTTSDAASPSPETAASATQQTVGRGYASTPESNAGREAPRMRAEQTVGSLALATKDEVIEAPETSPLLKLVPPLLEEVPSPQAEVTPPAVPQNAVPQDTLDLSDLFSDDDLN